MSKNFKYIKDSIKNCAKVCTVMLAGISFTLFGSSEECAVDVVFEQVSQVHLEEEMVIPSDGGQLEIVLTPNSVSNLDKMDKAFEKFTQEIGEDAENLRSAFYRIRDKLRVINFDKVSIDGNAEEGIINIAFRLPDGMILSVNNRLDIHDGNIVGFNLIHNRQLILSDMMSLSRLRNYIYNVQSRLV